MRALRDPRILQVSPVSSVERHIKMIRLMLKGLVGLAVLFGLVPTAVIAEPIKLKLSYFSSDRSTLYLAVIKPFVDAVNTEAKGKLDIEVYLSGALGKLQSQQPQLVDDGVADIAFIVVGRTPSRFEDSAVIELPGLFRDAREATLTYSRLIAANTLKGYENVVVIAAFCADPNSIHTRQPVASLADLKGLKIRANNLIEAAGLEKLGVLPVVLALPQTLDALTQGSLDGATVPPSLLIDFGIGRVASNHYLLLTSAAPLALVMSRRKFDALPDAEKLLIRKYSGDWMVARYLEVWEGLEKQEIARIKGDPRRKVIFPSQQDLQTARLAFKAVVEEWAATSTHNRDLLTIVDAELAKIRSSQ